MDISLFDYESKAEAGFWLEPLHPVSKKPVGIEIHLVGMDSKTFERASTEYQREVSQIEDLTGKTKEEKEDLKLDAKCRLWARSTKGWNGVDENDSKVEFSQDAAARIYRKYRGLSEQVDVAIASRLRLFETPKEG